MKTDRFTDSIRRKLESIRPEFAEKDWTKMQESLQQVNLSEPGSPPASQPFSGGVWSGKSWLLAAASVSTVVLVAFSMWQYREISQLRATLSQQRQNPTRPAHPANSGLSAPNAGNQAMTQTDRVALPSSENSTAMPNAKSTIRPQRDTVYVDRYVAVPAQPRLVPPEKELPTERLQTQTAQRYATTNQNPVSADQPAKSDTLTQNQQTDAYGASSTLSTIDKNSSTPPVMTIKPANKPGSKGQKIQDQYAGKRPANGVSSPANSTDKSKNAVSTTTPGITQQTGQQTGTSATYELAKSLPVARKAINWPALLAQRAKRMQPARPMPVVEKAPEKAPDSQPVDRVATRFRAGVGGEMAPRLKSVGVFTEVLIGSHWTLGVGLSKATYNGTFINDFDFDVRTRRNFRKEFARGIDPRRDILNIDANATRLQIPLQLGYRISLNRALTLVPTVGTSLTLNNTEDVTFYCPVFVPHRGFDEVKYSVGRSVDLINTFALSAGLEWQRGHWVVQASPVLTIPVKASQIPAQPEPNWQTKTTVGLRARLLYQF